MNRYGIKEVVTFKLISIDPETGKEIVIMENKEAYTPVEKENIFKPKYDMSKYYQKELK